MEHYIVYRHEDRYSSFAQIKQLDGRLAVTCRSGEYADHYKAILTSKRLVLVSSDEGRTWDESDDPTVPYNWPGPPYGEINRLNVVLPNGTWLSTGITRLEIWPADRRKEAT